VLTFRSSLSSFSSGPRPPSSSSRPIPTPERRPTSLPTPSRSLLSARTTLFAFLKSRLARLVTSSTSRLSLSPTTCVARVSEADPIPSLFVLHRSLLSYHLNLPLSLHTSASSSLLLPPPSAPSPSALASPTPSTSSILLPSTPSIFPLLSTGVIPSPLSPTSPTS
jgi:hypothetical protein